MLDCQGDLLVLLSLAICQTLPETGFSDVILWLQHFTFPSKFSHYSWLCYLYGFLATTGYLYAVCIYGELFLCSNGLLCDTSPKYCRCIALICSKFILQTTGTYIYKCRNNSSFGICLLYISTIFIEVMHAVSYIMRDTSTFFYRIKSPISFWFPHQTYIMWINYWQ
jgi:hypothetical protein